MNLPPSVLASFGVKDLATVDVKGVGKLVANQQPTLPTTDYRLAIIGEAPGADEDKEGKPFVGASGRLLNLLLPSAGIVREQCLVGNVCQYRPPNNQLSAWPWDSPPIQSSIERLRYDIEQYKPNCVLLLGANALYAATGDKRSISDWRGSMFVSENPNGPFLGKKCIATYHPANILRKYDNLPLLRFDLNKARQQATSPDLSLPVRRYIRDLTVDQIVAALETLAHRARTGAGTVWCSTDLEGYWNRITRISFAIDPSEGIIVPLTADEYGSKWSVEEECRIWLAILRFLRDPSIPKVLQNALYDRFVLAYRHRVLISNVAWDTMVAQHELYAELPADLGVLASINTYEPYWKGEREDERLDIKEIYCIKDSTVTEEIRRVQYGILSNPENVRSWNHLQFNLRLQNPILYMQLRGIKYDLDEALKIRAELLPTLWHKKHTFNIAAGRNFKGTRDDLLRICREVLCRKKDAPYVFAFQQLPNAALKPKREAALRIAELADAGRLNGPIFDDVTLGELEYLLDIELNVDSPPQMCEWLYNVKKFDKQFKEDKNGVDRLTSDVGAMLTLYHKAQTVEDEKDVHYGQGPLFKLALEIRKLLYKEEILTKTVDPDGRMRCGYNLCTKTARIKCRKSPTGSGFNLQTVTKEYRKLFRADDGYWFFQCDLAGADGWTVAAHCKTLGDATMWDDYIFGLKPAKIIARIYMALQERLPFAVTQFQKEQAVMEVAQEFNSMSRAQLKELCKEVDQDGWLYFGCKRVQHGSNYKMGPGTMSDQILKDSYKFLGEPIFVPVKVCTMIQRLYLMRYFGVERWQNQVADRVGKFECMTAASGRTRQFFGRKYERNKLLNHDTWKEACSNEPQDNTTYATNWALYNLWYDIDNRDGTRPGGLLIEPLHQVHDALIGQFPIECTEWAVGRIRRYLDNTLLIGQLDVKIPYEGGFGPSWGELKEGVI